MARQLPPLLDNDSRTQSRHQDVRVVISGHEICGLIGDLAEEFTRRGDEVVTIAMSHRFFPGSYDFAQYEYLQSRLTAKVRIPRIWKRLLHVAWRINPRWVDRVDVRSRLRLAASADLYVRVWGKIPLDREVLEQLEGSNTRVATFLMGSDVRDYNVFRQQYAITRWQFPQEYLNVSLAEKLAALRTHERFADVVFSVPDQMGLALRPYHHLQVPLQLSRFRYNVPGRAVPKILHAPSVPHVKGSDRIEEALDCLRREGIEFEFVSVRDLPHAAVLELLADSDVLVDELIGHGPGWLSFEAMASGCAVATRYLADSPECFRPPVVAINEHNIEDQLRVLLTDREMRIRIAAEGRRYVETNNSADRVVDMMLAKVQAGRSAQPDYVPTYLRDEYVPGDAEEARVINEANALVSREPWYLENVAGHAHDGLVF